MNSYSVEPIYDSIVVALLCCAAVLGLLILIVPPTANRSQRRWLIALRCVAASVLLVSVIRPAMVRSDNRAADATLVVAVDTSRSMTLPDDDRSDRWKHQLQAWRSLAEGLRGVDESMSLRLLRYDKTVIEMDSVAPESLDALSADGELTNIAAVATAAITTAQGQPLAGVVIMGDGTQTAPIEGTGAERIAQTLKAWGVPLWTVPIGQAAGQTASRDVGIDALRESFQLFSGNQFEVNFQVQLRGLAGITVPIQLSWIDTEGKSVVAAERQVVAEKASETKALSVPLTAPAPGIYRLDVQAEAQSGELVLVNNLQTAFVNVREGGGRILYLEGESRLEQRSLRTALRRFPDLDLTYQWIPRDTASRWPVNLNDWLEEGQFDVYILGDLDADAIGREQLSQLAETVAAGAGLVTLGGYQTYGTGGYASSPLSAVMPVQMDASRRREVAQDRQSDAQDQIEGPIEVRPARNHPITNLGSGGTDGVAVDGVWQSLPPLLGANRLLGPKTLPGVQVLLETPSQQPLLVVGEYGRGRTAALAIDSTWVWWREGQSEAHRRFWRQLVLWLLSREDDATDRIVIEMDSRRFAVDAKPRFRATLSTLAETATEADLVAEIVDAEQQVITITDLARMLVAGEQTISGVIPELTPGYYTLRVRDSDADSKTQPEELAIQVIDQSAELTLPMADPVYLRQLAEITSQHGGAAFTFDQMDELVARIIDRRKQAEAPVIEKFTLGDDPLSGWLLFILFAGMLSAEWVLRRRWGLA